MADRGMILSVVSWILLVAMICILITRLAMKFAMSRKGHRFGMDDVFIVLAAVSFQVFFKCQQVGANERSSSVSDRPLQSPWRQCVLWGNIEAMLVLVNC